MDYETLPTVLSRYSFNEKMRVCFYYSKNLMTIPDGILHGDELIGKPLPWELETFLMLAVKNTEWRDDDFCGNNIKKFIKIINCIKDFQHSSLKCDANFRADLFFIVTGLTQFDIQGFLLYKLYRYHYYFTFKNDNIDMNEEFELQFGLPYLEFLKFALYFHSFISAKGVVADGVFKYLYEKYSEVIKVLTLTRKNYISELDEITTNTSDYLYCLRPSYAFPFIQDNNALFLPLPHLIIKSVTSSLLYRLTSGNNMLTNRIGKEVFEEYLFNLVERSSTFDEIYREFEYYNGKSINKTIDIMLRKGNDYLFMDSKSTKPFISMRTFDEISIDKNIKVLAKSCVQMYKNLRNEFPQKYNPFKNVNEIQKENLWGIVVILEDSFVMREKIYQKAAEILNIEVNSEEYNWFSLHICVVQLYEIESYCFVGEDIIKYMKRHVEAGRCNDFLLANELEGSKFVNKDFIDFKLMLTDFLSDFGEELKKEKLIM